MSDDEIWRRWKASQLNINNNQLTPAEYREIDELEIEIEFEREVTPSSAPPRPTLRYPNADVEKLRVEAEDLLRQGRAVSAADLFEQAILLFESSPQANEAQRGFLLSGLGRAQHQKGSREEAESSLSEALSIARHEKEAALEQEACFGLGMLYLKQSRAALAADNLRQALAQARQRQDEAGEGRILLELGSAYLEQSMLNRAVPCLLMAQRLYARMELYPDYKERKEAEYRTRDGLQEARKKAEQTNIHLGLKQYQAWVADFETGKLLPQ